MQDTIILNLFAGAGAGKSTMAASIFAELKWRGVETELVTEFAKDLVWEKRFDTMKNQAYLLGEQMQRVERLIGQVDVIVTDSPILLSVIYKPENYSQDFVKFVVSQFKQYDNMNYYIDRKKPYNPKGRVQDEAEAKAVDFLVKSMLENHNIKYTTVKGSKDGVCKVVNEIIYKIDG